MPVPAGRILVCAAGRTVLSVAAPLALQRSAIAAAGRLAVSPRAVSVTTSADPPGEWLTPARPRPGSALLFLHGGGYAIGSSRSHRALAAWLARSAGALALVPDYRRAPEHRYPAALDDCLAAYESLLGRGLERIVVAGDSAGGGLALALGLLLRERDLPLPAAFGLICPWLDLLPDVDGTRAPRPRAPLLSPPLLTTWAAAYARGEEVSSDSVSPLHGQLLGLPPIIVHSAGEDPLAPDAKRLVAAVRAGGETIEHRHYPTLWHDFHFFAGLLRDADDALAELGNWLAAQLASQLPDQSSASTS